MPRLSGLVAALALAALLAGALAASAGALTLRSFVISSSDGGSFTVQGAIPQGFKASKGGNGSWSEVISYRGVSVSVYALGNYGAASAAHTAKNAAIQMAKINPGTIIKPQGGRYLLLDAKKRLWGFTVQAAAPEQTSFVFQVRRLTHAGSVFLGPFARTARVYFSTTDPKTVKSDPSGLALVNKIQAAIVAKNTASFSFSLGALDSFTAHFVFSDGYFDLYANGQMTNWAKGPIEYDLQSSPTCWKAAPATPVDQSLAISGYELKVSAPWQMGSDQLVSYSSYGSNGEKQPDVVDLAYDPQTFLPRWENVKQGGSSSSSFVATWDFQTPVAEQPQPTPLCK